MNFLTNKKGNNSKTIDAMNIVLRERSKGKSREECARLANIKLQRIQNWYNEGKNGYGQENIRFYNYLNAIEAELISNKKYSKEIKEYNKNINSKKRKNYINYIKKGQTRKEASKNSSLNLKLATKWDALGKKGIKPFKTFHNEYKNARVQYERIKKRTNDNIKKQTVNYIKKGETLENAAKLVENGKYEKTILNWYAGGKYGDKNHEQFYSECNKIKQKPVNSDILGPLPKKWKKYFENKPMNQTGIAWVYKVGNNYVYQRQHYNETIRIADPDIERLHKKVIARNYVWGIRDITKAKKIIKKDFSDKNNITVTYKRTEEDRINIFIEGLIDTDNVKKTLNKFNFFEKDKVQSHEIRRNDKTKITIEYNINISLMNLFDDIIEDLKWKKILK